MRFLHTSDWHLGRLFHGVHLTRDQEHVLDQFVELVRERDVDAVVVAGDLYDRAVPPPEAVTLLNDVFERIVLELKVPLIAIAGNHDSHRRVGFGSRMLAEQGLHIVGPVKDVPHSVTLEDEHGSVRFHPLPYAEPTDTRIAFGDENVRSHADSMQALVSRCERAPDDGLRHVLIAHAFVIGGSASDSERPLSVGGADTVPVECFDGFDYVALGHLHGPQRAGGRETVRYSGSLLKYSFSEAGHRKGVLLVDMDAQGACTHEFIPLVPRRDVRILEGTFDDLLEGPKDGSSAEDYLLLRVTDEGTLHDPMARLQAVYPNALQLERPALSLGQAGAAAARDHRKRSDRDLFADFFEHATGSPLDEAHESVLLDVLQATKSAEREAPSTKPDDGGDA